MHSFYVEPDKMGERSEIIMVHALKLDFFLITQIFHKIQSVCIASTDQLTKKNLQFKELMLLYINN